jgi:GNAT superfamily N-acetyltransferase
VRRGGIRVRTASPEDIDTIVGFAEMVRALPGSRRPAGRQPAPDEVRGRYETLLVDPDRRVVLAVDDTDAVLGMAVLTVDVAGELLDVPVVRISHLVVDRTQRRRGAGRALVAVAGSYADEIGVEHVTVGAATTDRESNRFLARLGFVPVAVHRVTTLAALRRHLAVTEPDDVAAPVPRRTDLRVRRTVSRLPVGRARDLA